MEQPKSLEDGVVINTKDFGKSKPCVGLSPTLLATDYKEPKLVLEVQPKITLLGNCNPSGRGMGGGQTAMVLDPPGIVVMGSLGTIGTTSEHNNRVHDPEGISPTATAVAGGTHHIKIFDYSRYRVRKLTPTEYGRLQGFPMDSWVQAVSNSQAYKQFGNAVTTTVAKGIATNIIAFLDSALGGGELGN